MKVPGTGAQPGEHGGVDTRFNAPLNAPLVSRLRSIHLGKNVTCVESDGD